VQYLAKQVLCFFCTTEAEKRLRAQEFCFDLILPGEIILKQQHRWE
jgi:hypothetical protein